MYKILTAKRKKTVARRRIIELKHVVHSGKGLGHSVTHCRESCYSVNNGRQAGRRLLLLGGRFERRARVQLVWRLQQDALDVHGRQYSKLEF